MCSVQDLLDDAQACRVGAVLAIERAMIRTQSGRLRESLDDLQEAMEELRRQKAVLMCVAYPELPPALLEILKDTLET